MTEIHCPVCKTVTVIRPCSRRITVRCTCHHCGTNLMFSIEPDIKKDVFLLNSPQGLDYIHRIKATRYIEKSIDIN